MTVRLRFLLGLTVALALQGETARAQYGFPVGRYGWGGWSSTVQGDMARGLGALAAGAGQYNQQTAVANSINADTVMRYNQYMYLAQQESNRREYARNERKIGRTNATAAETADRLRDRPDQGDIDRGDALNVLLDDLSSPALLQSSALRLAGGELDSAMVREVPFRNASEAVTICLDQLTDKDRFPELLRSKALTGEREAFIAAVRDARRQAQEQGEISTDAVRAVQATGTALFAKAKSPKIVATPAARNEALNYLKGMAALAKIAENPDVLRGLKELKQIEKTHVANLIGFMHTYNLRFGPADTPEQRSAYRAIYPVFKGDRDRIYAALTPQASQVPPPPDPKANPTELFQGIDEKQLLPPAPNP
jgi:hypothetical protein